MEASRPGVPAEAEAEARQAAGDLVGLDAAAAVAEVRARPGHARALAYLRDARWDAPARVEVPLAGDPELARTALEIVRLRLRDGAGLVRSRARGAAGLGALVGAIAGALGGGLLMLAPGSSATPLSALALAILGAGAGTAGTAAVVLGVAGAELVARSQRGAAIVAAAVLSGALAGAAGPAGGAGARAGPAAPGPAGDCRRARRRVRRRCRRAGLRPHDPVSARRQPPGPARLVARRRPGGDRPVRRRCRRPARHPRSAARRRPGQPDRQAVGRRAPGARAARPPHRRTDVRAAHAGAARRLRGGGVRPRHRPQPDPAAGGGTDLIRTLTRRSTPSDDIRALRAPRSSAPRRLPRRGPQRGHRDRPPTLRHRRDLPGHQRCLGHPRHLARRPQRRVRLPARTGSARVVGRTATAAGRHWLD